MPRVRGDLGIVNFKESLVVPRPYTEELLGQGIRLQIRGVDPSGDCVWRITLKAKGTCGHVTLRRPIEGPAIVCRVEDRVVWGDTNG